MKKVAVINDISGFGRCSLTAAIPVLSVMGIQCCPIPSAVLTNQTEYDYFHSSDLTAMMPMFTDAWKKNNESFDAIYSGYMTGNEQISHLLDFISSFRMDRTFLLVDPVMGDDGETYKIYNDGLLSGMKTLTRKADLITPNLTEACLLADRPLAHMNRYSQKEDLLKLSEEIGRELLEKADNKQEVVITGIKCVEDGISYMLSQAITADDSYFTQTKHFQGHYSGTGDLFASVMCGARLSGMTSKEGMLLASKFLYDSIEDTLKDNLPSVAGVNFEKFLTELAPQNK